jgi:hypothetical protein
MGQTQGLFENTSLDIECGGLRYWYVFLLSSLITFFGGLIIIFLWRGLRFITRYVIKNVNYLIVFAFLFLV